MTPFGNRIRELRARHNVTLSDMAASLQLSPAYLSALEHGHRGRPSPGLVQQICGYFNLVWDEVDDIKRLAQISHPKVTVDTAGLEPVATEFANLLSERVAGLSVEQLQRMMAIIDEKNR